MLLLPNRLEHPSYMGNGRSSLGIPWYLTVGTQLLPQELVCRNGSILRSGGGRCRSEYGWKAHTLVWSRKSSRTRFANVTATTGKREVRQRFRKPRTVGGSVVEKHSIVKLYFRLIFREDEVLNHN